MTHDSGSCAGARSTDGVRPPLNATRWIRAAADNIIEEVPKRLDLCPATQPKSSFEAVQAAIQKHQRSDASHGGPEPRSSLIDPIGVPEAVSASQEIRVPNRDEFGVSGSYPGAVPLRYVIVAGALVAALGLGWAGGWSSYHFLALAPAATPLEHTSSCGHYSGKDTVCVTSKSDREVPPLAANTPKIAAATSGVGRGDEPSRGAAQGAGVPAKRESLPNRQNASSSTSPAAVSQDHPKSPPRPVPETRPMTIEGWTVREVVGGTVILEGPNGIFKAIRGDAVPGVGRVDSIVRWGNHWIVATTKGLISTQN